MSLAKRNGLVTGSTSGIGLAIAKALAKEGANVMINGMGEAGAIEAERAGIEKDFGVTALYNGADMTRLAQIAAMVADAQQKLGSLDILVNNAGIQFVSPIEDFPPEKWDAIIAINLSSASPKPLIVTSAPSFAIARALARPMPLVEPVTTA